MNAKAEYRDIERQNSTKDTPASVYSLDAVRFEAFLASSPLGSSESQNYQALVSEDAARQLVRQARALDHSQPEDLPWESVFNPQTGAGVVHKKGLKDRGQRNQLSFRDASGRYTRRLAAMDALIGLSTALFSVWFVGRGLHDSTPLTYAIVLLSAAVWPALIGVQRGYERRAIGVGGEELRAVLRAGLVLLALTTPTTVLLHADASLVLVGLPVATTVSLTTRYFVRKSLHRRQRRGDDVRRVLVVGSVPSAVALCDRLVRDPYSGMSITGVCVPGSELPQATDYGVRILGDLSQVRKVIQDHGVDAVAVTSGDATRGNYLRELSWALEGSGVEMLVDPGLVEVAGPRMHIRPIVGVPLLQIEEPFFTGWRRLVKRFADIVLASTAIIVMAPLLAAIALAIKLQDGGPVLFRQVRVGVDGRSFTMLKFRSMVVDAEARTAGLLTHSPSAGPLFKLRHDPRITRLGRFLRDFSLDELPQLFNVVGGSMSLVGPRPQLVSEVELLQFDARRRLLVTPGITGLWQVSGRSDLAWEESVRLDLRYVENWSLTLDLFILWRTIFAVLGRGGVY